MNKGPVQLLCFNELSVAERVHQILTLSVAAEELDKSRQELFDYCYDIDEPEEVDRSDFVKPRIKLKRKMPTFKIGDTRILFRDVIEKWNGNWVQEWTLEDEQELRERQKVILTLSVAAQEIGVLSQYLGRSTYDIFDSTVSIDVQNVMLASFKVGGRRFVFRDDLLEWDQNRPKRSLANRNDK